MLRAGVEGMAEEQQLGLDVRSGAPPGLTDPGPADLEPMVLGRRARYRVLPIGAPLRCSTIAQTPSVPSSAAARAVSIQRWKRARFSQALGKAVRVHTQLDVANTDNSSFEDVESASVGDAKLVA